MKKIFSLAGILAAAAMTLVGCAEEIDQPNVDFGAGVPFELTANTADTKTVNDGLATKWAEGDALNVFYAEAGATEYSSNCEFKVADVATGLFRGTLTAALDETKSYDWYALYPYSSYVVTPKEPKKGYLTVGCGASDFQCQTAADSKAHIAGTNYPLYGNLMAQAADQMPALELELTHATTLLEVVVKNNRSESVMVSSVDFTAPEPVVGTFYIDFSGEKPLYTSSSEKNVSNVATLKVSPVVEIVAGATSSFYLAVKPFTASVNSELTLKLNGDLSKTVQLTEEKTFESGIINTLNFDLKADDSYIAPDVWGLVGTMTNWSDDGDIEMLVEGDYLVAKDVTLTTKDEFKFRTNKTWGTELTAGKVKPDFNYAVASGSGNISVTEDGTYDIYLDLANSMLYVMTSGKTPADATRNELVQVEFYCEKSSWTNNCLHLWGAISSGEWPGLTTEEVITINDIEYYKWTVETYTTSLGEKYQLLFHNGNGAQTADSEALLLSYKQYFKTGEQTEGKYALQVIEAPVEILKTGNYWIVSDGNYAKALSGNFGYLDVEDAGYSDNVFTFTQVEGGYTIQQADGKYMYQTGTYNNFNVAAEMPSEGHVWTVTKNEDGTYTILNNSVEKYIQYSTNYNSYGSYATENGLMPRLVDASQAEDRPAAEIPSNVATVTAIFSELTPGTQYAVDESHSIGDVYTLYTTECHLTSELRIYSSSSHNGYAYSDELPGNIYSISVNAGNKTDNLVVYGSNDGSTWTEVGKIAVTSTSYNDYELTFGSNQYKRFKLDVEGANQIRLKSLTVRYYNE